ncbi:MAG: hypothetical protein DMF56_02920 [Acidobacteria bacterium]|nr:MAG: hypothetical protein DMF56_02920 [Acidobacteriota bacterium]
MNSRSLLIFLLVIATIFAATGAYLALTTPKSGTPVHFPLSAPLRDLVARVPASADSFAVVPTAAALQKKLLANPVTRDAVEQWTSEHEIPRAWLFGRADAVIWREQKRTGYAVRLDTVRAFLFRIFGPAGTWDGDVFISDAGAPMPARDLDALLAQANGLPKGDVFAVQRDRSRGAFPPIERPAVTVVSFTPNDIVLTSRAPVAVGRPTTSYDVIRRPTTARHPRNALLSVTFVEAPRILDDVDRLLDAKLSVLVSNGGSIALYDVDAGTLVPRPKGVVAIPADDKARAEMQNIVRVVELVGETRDTGPELLVSFDRRSMPLYLKDAFEPSPWPATRWSLRLDPVRFAPILEKLGDNRALRLLAPRIYRSARDLRRWTSALQQAKSIEAADSVSGGVEELRVRIASK